MHIIENKKLNLQIFDKVYAVNKPKLKEIEEIEHAIETLPNREKLPFLKSKLVSCGIPVEVLDELDGDAFLELIEVINGQKKS